MMRTIKNIWELGLKELIGLLRNPLMLLLTLPVLTAAGTLLLRKQEKNG